ncbi:MAG: glycosyltransferase family 39 protein [Pseudomonadota bacterium]
MSAAEPLGTAYKPAGQLSLNQAFLMLWLVALALFAGQWSMPVTDRDEARYSQAATQMMETGDYVDIRFQEQPRYVKPAGIYWMQVITTQPFGGPDAPIGAYRIPSFLGILIASLMTAWIGAWIAGGPAGALAGGILGFSLLAGVEGRIAKTDAMLLASGTIAQLGLFMILVQPKGTPPQSFRPWPFLFWFGGGLAVLIKGPIITMVSAATIAGYVGLTRDWKALRRLRPLIGLVVFAVVGLTWVALITIQTEGAFIRESVGHALLGKVAEGDDAHGGPPGYHTVALPIMFWPGTALLFLAGAAAWARRKEPAIAFLISWIIPTWIIFEVVATKLPHYVLPAYPALAILAAIGVRDAPSLLESKGVRRGHMAVLLLFSLVTLALAALPYIGVSEMGGEMITPAHIATTVMGLVCLGVGVWVFRRPTIKRLAYASLAPLAYYAVVLGEALPQLHTMWPAQTIAKVASQIEGCSDVRFATAGYREPSNVFYLGTDTFLTDGEGAAQFLRENASCGVVIVDRREAEEFDARTKGLRLRELAIVEGYNVSKGRDLEMRVLVQADSPLYLGRGSLRRL